MSAKVTLTWLLPLAVLPARELVLSRCTCCGHWLLTGTRGALLAAAQLILESREVTSPELTVPGGVPPA